MAERELIGELKPRPSGQPMGDASDRKIFPGQVSRQIETRCVPLDVSPQRDDKFLDRFLLQTSFQHTDSQVFRFDAVQWRDFAAEHMILSAKRARLFDAENVDRLFHDTNQRGIATRVRAEMAGIDFGERTADLAKRDAVASGGNRFGEVSDRHGIRLHQVQGDTFGGARADSRQLAEGGYQG